MTAATFPVLESRPSKGLVLAFTGGLALSFDIPLIRLAGSDPYMVMALRGVGLAIVLWLYWRFWADRSGMPNDMLADRDFLIVSTLSGIGNIFFTMAVFNTSTANVVFILAFNAMIAALLSWKMIGERLGLHTWATVVATLAGVLIIVSDSLTTGNWRGDLFALATAVLLALSLTITRRSGKDLSLAPGFGGAVSALFALPTVLMFSAMPEAPTWLVIDAFVLEPLAGITLWLPPRYISAPQVALFYLLETVLAPLWVWYVFSETPTTAAFIGGSIVIMAIGCHTLFELLRRRA